ncbi:hemolysin family protein [Nocardioides insulae]|uniref:hemolysin family protein n=1 Tax=Nocardioides insulae TaxID=394734 RepID=UPI000490C920|nr:hemolysin family protein [Nocardioides insulae]
MDGQTLTNFLLVLGFVLLGGVFAATEIALVSLRESQLSQLERRGSRGARVAQVARDPNRFLAAVQIGVTVAGFFSAAYGASTLAPDLAPYLEQLGLAEGTAQTVALVAMTLFIAYLSLVLGELVPKRLALQKAAGLALLAAPVLDRFATVMRPVIWVLSKSTDLLVRLLGGDPKAVSEQLSEEELRDLVSTHEGLEEQERRILGDVFAATETRVKEVMRPRGDVEFLSADMPLGQAITFVQQKPFSRYPVIGDGVDDVLGFLHVRDLLGLPADERRTVGEFARPIVLLPGSKLVLPSVATMRENGTHLAVVVDEYGGTDGIVTLEDLVEELVGEIRDEYDHRVPGEAAADLSSVDAGLSLADFAERTGLQLSAGDYETVAGYVIARIGRIPQVGDMVSADGAEVAVTAMEGNRVTRVAARLAQE